MNLLLSLYRFSCTRASWLVLLASALSLMGAALWFQHQANLEPCLLCIYIRIAVLGIALTALIGLMKPNSVTIRSIAIVGWVTSAGLGLEESIALMIKQAGTASKGLFGQTCDYIPNFPQWAPLHEWLPELFQPRGQCSDAPWVWLGVTMAEWMVVAFSCYMLIALTVVLSQFIVRK